jgi:hypothetical protein
MELRSLGQCEQVSAHPARERAAGFASACAGHTAATAWKEAGLAPHDEPPRGGS